MGLFKKLSSLFDSERLPGEDRKAYAQARDLDDLMLKLEQNLTRNEVILRQVRGSINRLESSERGTVDAMQRGEVKGREVRLALQTVNRYRKQLDLLIQKSDILNKNLNLNLNLMGKIELMRAMELKGVSPELIDTIILDFTENVERYQTSLMGSDAITEDETTMLSENERKELESLEKEIFGKSVHYARQQTDTQSSTQQTQRDTDTQDFEEMARKLAKEDDDLDSVDDELAAKLDQELAESQELIDKLEAMEKSGGKGRQLERE